MALPFSLVQRRLALGVGEIWRLYSATAPVRQADPAV
jgi:hypothetical protein